MRVRAMLAAAALGVPSTAASAAPRVLPGWPVAVHTGSVQPGPQGGPVVIGEGSGVHPSIVTSVAAFRPDGRRLWVSAFALGCGNCEDNGQPGELQADGTYGPIGAVRGDFWSVTKQGKRVAGCSGLVLADTTCINHTVRVMNYEVPVLRATRGASQRWEYVEQGLRWAPTFLEGPPRVFHDLHGTAYTSFAAGTDPVTSAPLPERLVAVDERSGQLRWRQTNVQPLAYLAQGVIALRPTGELVRLTDDGAAKWSTLRCRYCASPRVGVDEARNLIYVDRSRGSSPPPDVIALDATNGVEAWRTAPADHARLLSVGSGGAVYVAINHGGRTALRAIGPGGRVRWQMDTASNVAGARELGDGTLVLATEGVPNPDGGLLWRIDLRTATRPDRSTSFTLSRTSFRAGCDRPDCEFISDLGTVLRIAVPAATPLRILVRDLRGGIVVPRQTIVAPAGVSFVRLLTGWVVVGRGGRMIEIRRMVRSREAVTRLPVTVR